MTQAASVASPPWRGAFSRFASVAKLGFPVLASGSNCAVKPTRLRGRLTFGIRYREPNMHSATPFGIIFLLLSGSLCPLRAQTVQPVTNSLSIAAPFGVTIGKTTCRQAANALKMRRDPLKLDSIPASAVVQPEGYPGAGLFSISCQLGGDTPVTYASLTIFGGSDQYDTVVSDLASKYKKIGPREDAGHSGLELQASNGNVMVYSQKTYQPAPRELLIEIRYNSLDGLEIQKRLEQKKNDAIRSKESARRNVL